MVAQGADYRPVDRATMAHFMHLVEKGCYSEFVFKVLLISYYTDARPLLSVSCARSSNTQHTRRLEALLPHLA